MASIIRYESKPVLKNPIFIECLPGVGNVGKIAGDFLADALEAELFARIYSEHLPPQVMLNDECVAELICNELWFVNDMNGKDVIFLRGEDQGATAEGQFEMSKEIIDILLEFDASKVITLGGYGTGVIVEEPRVLGAVSRAELKPEFEEYGVVFSQGEPSAGIIGASGVILGLGKVYGLDSACLMGETSGYFLDHKSAMAIVKVLVRILGVDVDMKDLAEKSEQIEALTAKMKEFEDKSNYDDLGYIG